MPQITVFCPATVANLSCGYDVLGLCLDHIGDNMTIRTTARKGIVISNISGAELPYETHKNVAGVAGLALLSEIDSPFGFEIEIEKRINAGSGMGSSSASAAGAVYGINELLGSPFSVTDLVRFAMKGEALASGFEHADNVAPALIGGFTLVRSTQPLDIIHITAPAELFVTVINPQIELKTSQMRAVLPADISLKKATEQWGNVGAFVAGLYTSDYELLRRSLTDVVIEPFRREYIPGFDIVREAAMKAGALGSGISGSGPSIFTLSKGKEMAEKVKIAISERYTQLNIPFRSHVSAVGSVGTRII